MVSTVDTNSEFYTVARPFLFLYFVRGFGAVKKSLKVVNAKASLIHLSVYFNSIYLASLSIYFNSLNLKSH